MDRHHRAAHHQPHALERKVAEPRDAGADTVAHLTAAHGDQPAERVLHADRQGVGPAAVGQRNTLVDLPAVRRSAGLLQSVRQVVERFRAARRARRPRPRADPAATWPATPPGPGSSSSKARSSYSSAADCRAVRRRSQDTRDVGALGQQAGGRVEQALQRGLEVGHHLLALGAGQAPNRLDVVLGVGDEPLEHEQRGALGSVSSNARSASEPRPSAIVQIADSSSREWCMHIRPVPLTTAPHDAGWRWAGAGLTRGADSTSAERSTSAVSRGSLGARDWRACGAPHPR